MNAEIFAAIHAVLQDYFEGLYHGNTKRLAQVFHPQALYATAVGDKPLIWWMDEYFPVVDARPTPVSRGDSQSYRVLSIELAGPVTALAKLECSLLSKHFTDLLTLIYVDGRWQIIAKVFHYEFET